MRAIKWIICLSLTVIFLIGSSGFSKDLERQYGIELRGGFGLYLDNADPNSFVKNFQGTQGYSQKEYTESQGSLTGGFSLLYKSRPYFAWHVGLNVLATDSATAVATHPTNDDQMGRIYFRTVEIFVSPTFYWNISPRFNLQAGAGPAFYLASLDRENLGGADVVYGDSFYGAHGRSFGFRGELGAELFLSKAVSLRLGGGFRWAQVNRFKYYTEFNDPEQPNITLKKGVLAYWPGTYDTFEVDFSGVFAEVGLRIYFEPAAKWKQYD